MHFHSFAVRGDEKLRTRDVEKQERIKQAMVSLILREGIDGASVSKIAKEAGVSPATIYVYYNSKEEMISDVFRECAQRPYQYIARQLHAEMGGEELIDTIVRGAYTFSTEFEEVFSFVEQCSRCPTLSAKVCEEECSCDILELIHSYQERGILKRYSDWNMGAVLFAPVRFLAMNRTLPKRDIDVQLDELVQMLQALLLR